MELIGRALLGDTSCPGEIADGRFHVLSGDVFGARRRAGPALALSDVKLGPPIEGCRFVNVMGGFRMADRPGFEDLIHIVGIFRSGHITIDLRFESVESNLLIQCPQ